MKGPDAGATGLICQPVFDASSSTLISKAGTQSSSGTRPLGQSGLTMTAEGFSSFWQFPALVGNEEVTLGKFRSRAALIMNVAGE